MDNKRLISKRLEEHMQMSVTLQSDKVLQDVLSEVAVVVAECFESGNKVYLCGNGGSAADAQHLAAEFSGRFYIDRCCLPAEALHCNTSYLTAVANDYSFDLIYSRIITGIGKKGDVLIGISTSGNSKNIVNSFDAAKSKGVTTIAFVGHDGGLMKQCADYTIVIPSNDTPRIQESHILLGHIMCEIVEDLMFGENKK